MFPRKARRVQYRQLFKTCNMPGNQVVSRFGPGTDGEPEAPGKGEPNYARPCLALRARQPNGDTTEKPSFYFVRVEQEDGEMAWASPSWVTSKSLTPPCAAAWGLHTH